MSSTFPFEDLSLKLQHQIALNLNVRDLLHLSLSNHKMYREIFKDDGFWKNKRDCDFQDTKTYSQMEYYQQQRAKRLASMDVIESTENYIHVILFVFGNDQGLRVCDADLVFMIQRIRKVLTCLNDDSPHTPRTWSTHLYKDKRQSHVFVDKYCKHLIVNGLTIHLDFAKRLFSLLEWICNSRVLTDVPVNLTPMFQLRSDGSVVQEIGLNKDLVRLF
jgi:hypothetical protein